MKFYSFVFYGHVNKFLLHKDIHLDFSKEINAWKKLNICGSYSTLNLGQLHSRVCLPLFFGNLPCWPPLGSSFSTGLRGKHTYMVRFKARQHF